MKALKRSLNGIVVCLMEVLVGILLLVNPVEFTSGIIIAAGIVLMIAGLVCIVRYFRTGAREAAISQLLAKGLIAVLAGGVCAFRSHWFIATFPVLTIIYGIAILVIGIFRVQVTVDMIRTKTKKWFLALISAIISIACGVIILGSPFTSTAVLWMFTGISLIVEAVFDLITLIVSGGEGAVTGR